MSARRLLLGVGIAAALVVAEPGLAAESPQLGKSALVRTVSGTVRVIEKGDSRAETLPRAPTLVPMGSSIDATLGKVRVRTARKGRGLDDGTFWKGAFGISQERRSAITQLVLLGESLDSLCAAPEPTVLRRLRGESDDPYRTVGWFSGVEVTEPDTRWLTEDRCDGTRHSVATGEVQAYDGPVVESTIEERSTNQHFCDYDGVEPVSRFFCTMVYFAPHLAAFGGGIVTLGDATAYDFCVTDPAGVERCETYPLSEPFDEAGHRFSVIGCSAPSGPGAYSQRWLIDGVQLGHPLGFRSERPPGQDCIHRP